MSHFSYPSGWISPVPSGHVPGPVEYELLWDQVYASVNGDGGGTWAPSAFITVGGSGFQLTGTGHSLAASARLNVESTGEIRLKNGALLKVDGSGGDIRLEVLTNVATLTVQSGAVAQVSSGGALDIYGAITLKDTGGPGSITAEANTTITLSSGATLNTADGSTVNLTGTTNVRGPVVLKASGGPGSLTQEATTAVTLNGNVNFGSTAVITYSSGAEVNGLITRKGAEVRDGSSARTAHRVTVLLDDADQDITVAEDSYKVRDTVTGSWDYTVRHTGTVPKAGERIIVTRIWPTATSSFHSPRVKRQDGTVLFLFEPETQGWVELEYDGTAWVVFRSYKVDALLGSGIYGN
jgi:hypothetical protein